MFDILVNFVYDALIDEKTVLIRQTTYTLYNFLLILNVLFLIYYFI